MDRSAMIDQLVEARYAAKVASGYKISNPAYIRSRIATDLSALTDAAMASELGLGPKPNHGLDYGVTPLGRAIGLARICFDRGLDVNAAAVVVTDEFGPEIAGQAVSRAHDAHERKAAS